MMKDLRAGRSTRTRGGRAAGATATLVEDPGGDDLLVVASRALVAGDAVTRDYGRAPSLGFIDGSDADPASESEILRRLLQFGLHPQWSSSDVSESSG